MKTDWSSRRIKLLSSAKLLRTSWSARIIQLASSARSISTDISAQQLAVSVRASAIAFKAILGRFVFFLDKEDSAAVSDLNAIELRKSCIDSIATLDRLSNELRAKKEDGAFISDAAKAAAVKSLQDLASILDRENIALGKTASDAARFIDAAVQFSGKSLYDSAVLSEAKAKTFSKTVADNFAALDAAAKGLSRGLVESCAVIDAASRTLTKGLFDIATVTDDVDGQASILDDETMSFLKGVSNQVRALDAIELVSGFNRTFADALNAYDLLSNGVFKSPNESVSATDQYTHLFDKRPIDTAVLADRYVVDSQKSISDAPAVYDLLAFLFGTARSESFDVSDSSVLETGKNQYETLGIADEVTRLAEYYRAPNETVALNQIELKDLTKTIYDLYVYGDYFAGDYTFPAEGMQISDYMSPLFGKVPSETLSWSDVKTLAGTKGLSELLAVSESRSALLFRSFTDSAFVTDDVDGQASIDDDQEIQFTKGRTEQIVLSDAVVLSAGFNRALAESAKALDASVFVTAKPLSDQAGLSDLVARTGLKAIPDAGFFSDSANKANGKVFIEQTSIADTGFLRSQGYSDFTYFAEDFVGASRSF